MIKREYLNENTAPEHERQTVIVLDENEVLLAFNFILSARRVSNSLYSDSLTAKSLEEKFRKAVLILFPMGSKLGDQK